MIVSPLTFTEKVTHTISTEQGWCHLVLKNKQYGGEETHPDDLGDTDFSLFLLTY